MKRLFIYMSVVVLIVFAAILRLINQTPYKIYPDSYQNLLVAQNPYEAAKDADVIFLLVEWPELTHLNLEQLAQAAKPNAVFIDTRNQYPKSAVESTGMRYLSIGN